MLLTFIVSAIEGHCFNVTQAPDKIESATLSFESCDINHIVEATINENLSVANTALTWTGSERIKLSVPGLLSIITSVTSGFSITHYFKSVISIYFSNLLFLIFGNFTI